MDLRLFWSVIRRHKRLTITGPILGIVLAVLSYGHPGLSHGKPTVIPRGAEVWESQSELLVTQQGFPYGSAVQQFTPASGKAQPVPIGDISHLSSLAQVYVLLANGTAIQTELRRAAPVPGTVKAAEVFDPNTGGILPFVQLTATAPTSADARILAAGAAKTLQNWIASQQTAAGVTGSQRAVLAVVQNGSQTTLVTGHKLTIPMMVFIAFLAGSLALAFMLDNPRRRPEAGDGTDGAIATDAGASPVATRLIHSVGRSSALASTPPTGADPERREARS